MNKESMAEFSQNFVSTVIRVLWHLIADGLKRPERWFPVKILKGWKSENEKIQGKIMRRG